ncbi:hypothetical protein USDA257_c48550 [Sinorhizobium fredii USDA 257]|uniref:DUF4062 domain-containing protein n=2 Tax=Rhizobium fredii TaxID=380 RepID=I3XBY4_SINF2|nr:hypothetical protein USDA257_c48550 [Sinorhizobium fredii USDA 257]
MELFPAANETQWNLIRKVIDDSDYYALILGGRYGSLGPDGLSYTEMEYRYALEIGKPTVAFLHRDPGKIVANKTEATEEGRQKLKEFRHLVEKKLCKHWDTAHELGSVVSRSLIQLIKANPAVGWVRANEVPDRDATLELLKLRRQVEDLKSELQRMRKSAPEGTEGLAQGEEDHRVRYRFSTRESGRYMDHAHYNANILITWNDLFATVAPRMIHESTDDELKSALNSLLAERAHAMLGDRDEFKRYELRGFDINDDDFQTLKVQFRALGLIAKSEKARSVKDSGTYWTLTPYGDEVMTRLRAIRSDNEAAELGASGAVEEVTPEDDI